MKTVPTLLAAVGCASLLTWSRLPIGSSREAAADTGVEVAAHTLVLGRVTDRHGRPIHGVMVVATPAHRSLRSSGPEPTTVTDDRGRFSLADLAPGRYVFVAIHGRHAAGVSSALPVAAVGHTELEIILDHDSVEA